MDRNKRLIKNTMIYFIGNISSKMMVFILLPLYTSYLTPEQYGMIDMVFTYTGVIIPVVTLQITFAGFRFLFDTENYEEQKNIISNTIVVNVIGILILTSVYYIFYKIFKFEYGGLIISYLVLNLISTSLQQLIRGLRKNEIYALVGVVSTLVQLLCNILFIVGLGFGSKSLLIAPIISYIASIILIISTVNIVKYIDIKSLNWKILRKMLKYSLPLVPDAVCWWLLLGFGRMFLEYTHGLNAVGIYGIANKFPSILTMLYSIFNLAWQENSFSEYDKDDRNYYYSQMYNKLILFVMPIIIIIIPITKIISNLIIGKEFASAYLIIPVLYITALISMLATFYGAGFESSKETSGILVSTLWAMGVNIILNVLLTSKFSLYGTSIALTVSYIVLLISRVKRSKKFFEITCDFKSLSILSLGVGIALITHYLDSTILQIIIIFMGFAMFIYFNKEMLVKIKCAVIKSRM